MKMERQKPTAEDGYLMRICKALRMSPRDLARALDVPFKAEFEPLLHLGRSQLAEIDRHDMWWELKAIVDVEIGYLLAIQAEMNKALQKDRAARLTRVMKAKEHHERDR